MNHVFLYTVVWCKVMTEDFESNKNLHENGSENSTSAYSMAEEPPKKKGKWGIAIIVYFVYIIALMFLLNLLISPQDSFVATIVAYALGLVGLAIFSALTRSKWKVLVSNPLLLIITFGLGYLFSFVLGLPVYNPFAPISERSITTLTELANISASFVEGVSSGEIIFFLQFLFLIDLLIAMFVFFFATLSFTWFAQIFTSKPKILTIFSVIFALTLFIIGVLLLPIVHLSLSGVINIGANSAMGGFYTLQAVSAFGNFDATNQTSINEAVMNFQEASQYFGAVASDLGAFFSILNIVPVYGGIANDLNAFLQAAFILYGGLGPLLNGSYQIFSGFDMIGTALGTNTSLAVSAQKTQSDLSLNEFSEVNDTLFNLGMVKINDGLYHFRESIDYLDDAYDELKNVDFDRIYETLGDIPADVAMIIQSIQDAQEYINLFEGASAGLKVLLEKPELSPGVNSSFTTLSHFLYGFYNIIKATDLIGTSSAFNGTEEFFERASNNFTVVYSQLQLPESQNLINSDTPFINETFLFLNDMTGLLLSTTEFGLSMGQTFDDLNTLTDVLSDGFQNVTDYDPVIDDADAFVISSNQSRIAAESLDLNMTAVKNNAEENKYGMLNAPALEFISSLEKFGLLDNADDAYYIANSFANLFRAMKYLSIVQEDIDKAYIALDAAEAAVNVPDYPLASIYFTESRNNLTNAIDNLETSIGYMNETVEWMGYTQEGDHPMTQLADTYAALTSIRDTMIDLKQNLEDLRVIMDALIVDPANFATYTSNITDIVDDIQTNFNSINDDLKNVNAQ